MDMKNIDSLLFNINMPQPQTKPLPGRLLVAEPFLRESYFNHAVVLMLECDDSEPAMGLVLNRPSEYVLSDVIPGVPDELADYRVMCGGPVDENRLFYIHSQPSMFNGAVPVAGNVYVGGDFEAVKDYVASGMPVEGNIHFFLGYSGWEPLQLQEEIERNVWAVDDKPHIESLLKCKPEKMWHKQVRSMGEDYRTWLYHPQYPIMN